MLGSLMKCVCVCVIGLLLTQGALAQTTWFVDAGKPPGGDGETWATAFDNLHDALDNPDLFPGHQIWVAAGTYVPSQSSNIVSGNAFDLPERVRLYGGFAGTETSLGERAHVGNVFTNETILTHMGNHFVVLAGKDMGDGVSDFDEGDRTYVNGFTIHSGGVVLDHAAPVFIRCRFISNSRAVHAHGQFDPQGANRGPVFVNCEFLENGDEIVGGAVLLIDADATFTNCLFVDNTNLSTHPGGAIRSVGDGDGTITNCTFFRNSSEQQNPGGGAIHLAPGSAPKIWNIRNSIFWANTMDTGQGPVGGEAAQIYVEPSGSFPATLQLDHSLVEGLTTFGGQGNIDDDPVFVSETTPDLRLQAGSPAVDAGRNNVVPGDIFNVADDPVHNPNRPTPDLDLGPRRVVNGVVDMGPYEYVPEGDLAGSGTVGLDDLDALLANYGCEGECIGDFNLDEVVDEEDVVILLELMEGE